MVTKMVAEDVTEIDGEIDVLGIERVVTVAVVTGIMLVEVGIIKEEIDNDWVVGIVDVAVGVIADDTIMVALVVDDRSV